LAPSRAIARLVNQVLVPVDLAQCLATSGVMKSFDESCEKAPATHFASFQSGIGGKDTQI
jgi:hypothetical protein